MARAPKASAGTDMTLVKALADILDEAGLAELEYETDSVSVRLSRITGQPAAVAPVAAPAATTPAAATAPAGVDAASHPGAVISPMVGRSIPHRNPAPMILSARELPSRKARRC